MTNDIDLDNKYEGLKRDIEFLEEFRKDWNRLCNLAGSIPFNRSRNDIDKSSLGKQESLFTSLQVVIVKNYGRLMQIYLKTKLLPNFGFISETETELLKAAAEIYKFGCEANIYDKERFVNPQEGRRIQLSGIAFISTLKGLVEAHSWYKKLATLSLYAIPTLTALLLLVKIFKSFFIR